MNTVGRFVVFAVVGCVCAVAMVATLLLAAECEQKLAGCKPRALAMLAVGGVVLLSGLLFTLHRM